MLRSILRLARTPFRTVLSSQKYVRSGCTFKIILLSSCFQLILNFPSLRLLWSRSPHATVDIFQTIAARHDEVDVDRAVRAGKDPITLSLEANIDVEYATNGAVDSGRGRGVGLADAEDARTIAQDVLLSMPGVSVNNYHLIMAQVTDISTLAMMSQQELVNLIGSAAGNKLFSFLNQSS